MNLLLSYFQQMGKFLVLYILIFRLSAQTSSQFNSSILDNPVVNSFGKTLPLNQSKLSAPGVPKSINTSSTNIIMRSLTCSKTRPNMSGVGKITRITNGFIELDKFPIYLGQCTKYYPKNKQAPLKPQIGQKVTFTGYQIAKNTIFAKFIVGEEIKKND